jgi:hypothetical protein
MNVDNYDYKKSIQPQSIGGYTPFVEKQSNNYINDLNGGQYSSNQSLVQIDLSSLFNSSRWTNSNDLFLTIPITMVCCTSVNATTAPAANSFPNAGWALQSLKSGYHNLIHSCDLVINGTTVTDTQPFNGLYNNIRLLSELSQNDLKSVGSAIGFSSVLDTPQSKKWGAAGGAGTTGNGLTNNSPFGESTQITPGTATVAGTATPGYQNLGLCNHALNERVLKVFDATKSKASVGGTNIVGNIVSLDQLKRDFKPTFEVVDTGRYGVIYDLAIIRLKDILDVCGSIGIIKRFGQAMLRLYINTGSLQVTVGSPDNAVSGYSFNVVNSTFQNACPFTINNLGLDSAGGGIKALNTIVTAGLFIGRALSTSGVNLGASGATHPMSSVRLYYSSIVLEPEKALAYSRTNSAKQIVYKNYYFNQINAVGVGGTHSQLIQSGIRNPYALIIVPFISSTFTSTIYTGAGTDPFGGVSGYQWQSPFDDGQGSPCILSQLQVQLGGQQILSNPYNYSFENYLTEFSNCESLSSSDFGVSCGLVSKEYWEQNRVYYVNLSRGTRSDNNTPRNIVLNFKNDSLCPVDVMVFTVFLDEFTINVDNGMITRTTPIIDV